MDISVRAQRGAPAPLSIASSQRLGNALLRNWQAVGQPLKAARRAVTSAAAHQTRGAHQKRADSPTSRPRRRRPPNPQTTMDRRRQQGGAPAHLRSLQSTSLPRPGVDRRRRGRGRQRKEPTLLPGEQTTLEKRPRPASGKTHVALSFLPNAAAERSDSSSGRAEGVLGRARRRGDGSQRRRGRDV